MPSLKPFEKLRRRFRFARIPREHFAAAEILESRIVLATLIWDGSAGDGDWLNSQNWDGNAVPTIGDVAILNINSTINVATNVEVDSFQQSAGILTGAGVLRIARTFVWSGGVMSGSGITEADGAVVMNGGAVLLDSRTLELAGGVVSTLSGPNAALAMQNGARINNAGTFLVQTDVRNALVGNGAPPALFMNSGTFVVDPVTPGARELFVPFANEGTIDLRNSDLVFHNGFVQSAGGAIIGGNRVTFAGGMVMAGGSITANVVNSGAALSPGESGVGDLTITGNYVQGAGGTLRMELRGVAAGEFDRLTINGTASFDGRLNLSLLDGFVPLEGQPVNVLSYQARSGTFANTTGASTFAVTYQQAALVLIGDIPVTYTWDAGGVTDTNWLNRLNWSPDGLPGPNDSIILDSNATIFLSTTADVASFTQSAGTFTGFGRLNVKSFVWSGGLQAGPGTTAVAAGGLFSIEGDLPKIASARTLSFAGSGRWSGLGNIQLGDGAVLNNDANFEIQNDARLEFPGNGAEPLFVNRGIVRKTSNGTTVLAGFDFVNTGQLRLAAGIVSLEGVTASFTQMRGMTLLAGGELSATNIPLIFEDGVLAGSGTLAASVVNRGAIVHPGGRAAPGMLEITGDYAQSGTGRLVIELGGKKQPAKFDRLVVGGLANLGGVLEVNSIGGFVLRPRTTFDVVSYATFGALAPTLDAPAGVTANSGASALILNAQAPPPGVRLMRMTELDGDVVTAQVTRGTIPQNGITMGANGEFQRIDLRTVGSDLKGAKVMIEVQQAASGDGKVNVGAIDATGMDLSKIILQGDLGQIDIGTGSANKSALKKLKVQSLGALGAATQPNSTEDPLLSEVTGSLDKLTVEQDVQNAVIEVSGKLGKVVIGGSLVDNRTAAPLSPAAGGIGVFLNGGIPPLDSSDAGSIFAPSIGEVTVNGNVDGGEIGSDTGIKKVKIMGDLTSDDPLDPAILRVGTNVDKVVITGNATNALILAGYSRELEPQNSDARIGKVKVKGNWLASSVVAGIADPEDNGFGVGDILIDGDTTPDVLSKIASVIIDGSAMGSATLTDQSAITAQKIKAVRITGLDLALTDIVDNLLIDAVNENFRAIEI